MVKLSVDFFEKESTVSIILFIWNYVEKDSLTCGIGLLCFLWLLYYVDPVLFWYVCLRVNSQQYNLHNWSPFRWHPVNTNGTVTPLRETLFVWYGYLCKLFLNIKKKTLLLIVLESCEVTGTKVEIDIPSDNPGGLSF